MLEDSHNIRVNKQGISIYKKDYRLRIRRNINFIIKQEPSWCTLCLLRSFLKIHDQSTSNSIYDSLVNTYEGGQQIKCSKSDFLIQQYEMFKMKGHEDTETMFSRSQTLVFWIHVLNKSHTTTTHVNKIHVQKL